ncbi:MAG TPA: prepilin-type N-terminal cleavage/methylation domain-containing protein [Vicinamibacterales bacterium]|nr:prepilin-type N-terminal cleavage/methylation domain-containing protein [Vicinamibacterales bacterium]
MPIRNSSARVDRILAIKLKNRDGRSIAVDASGSMMIPSLHSHRGFSLIDMLVVASLIGIIMAITVPSVLASLDAVRLGQAARGVEREMQVAKSRAVGKGRAMRVRFNCPAAGQYRITELLGTVSVPTAADAAANRCDPAVYPFPAGDNNPITLPNHDGPVQRLDTSVTFDLPQTVEFWPDGTAHYPAGGAASPWPMIPVAGIEIRLVRNGVTATITVNGLGKIQLQTQ